MTIPDGQHSLTLYGRGGHGSQPHRTIDPIVMAANIITRLQTIPSREVAPDDMSVVTVGAVNAGDAENIIPDKAELRLNIRTVQPQTRKRVIESMKRIINAESEASNAPSLPYLKETTSFPFTVNDEDATKKIESTFRDVFEEGKHAYDSNVDRLPGSEDFSVFATSIDRPSVFFVYGGTDADKYDRAEREGKLHSGMLFTLIA
jgi:amidohydrolase